MLIFHFLILGNLVSMKAIAFLVLYLFMMLLLAWKTCFQILLTLSP